MFRYCPHCASQEIQFTEGKRFFCPDCNFTYYHNTAAACALIIESNGKIVTLVRGKEPGKGKLDFPGGFVDPNEGVIEALRRECREELSFDPGENINFLASFPNQYPYKNVVYNTCDMFFIVKVSGLNEKDFTLDTENSGVSFLKPEEIDPQDFAFVSARKAFMLYRDSLRKTRGLPS